MEQVWLVDHVWLHLNHTLFNEICSIQWTNAETDAFNNFHNNNIKIFILLNKLRKCQRITSQKI